MTKEEQPPASGKATKEEASASAGPKTARASRKTASKTAKSRKKKETPRRQPSSDTGNDANDETTGPVRVVAIGASAGGLEPIEQFFDAMPVDSGLAVVIIQHLSPDFRSMMDQLLARHSTMRILHAEHGMRIEANNVYLNPPRTDLTVKDGMLYTREQMNPELLGLPIDSFFRSLAEDQGERSIGIVLSGTGSDGSRGGLAIREAGGTVIVQEPTSAKFDSMPRAAIERDPGAVVTVPHDMPALLMKIARGETIEPQIRGDLEDIGPERRILSLLERRYGADFGYYKQTTVERRIRRRALLNQIHSIEKYAETLVTDVDELEALYCDLLIGVTSFFRDREAYEVLNRDALPLLASIMSNDRAVRVWVAGCASGEEAYSIAILLSEFARNSGMNPNIKIFATDIHFNSLEIAANGVYREESLSGLDAALVERYFTHVDGRYQVKPTLRKMVVFSPHNLIKDPPFTRIDLISCRNLMIYLDDVAQRKVLAFFHFALRKNGILFLGSSETTGDLQDEFETVSKKWRIFRKKRDVRLRESTQLLPLSITDPAGGEEVTQLSESRPTGAGAIPAVTAQRQLLVRAYDRVLEKYAPPSLLINRNGELVHIFGDASRYLQLHSGMFTKRLADILMPELRLVVSAGIERAQAQQRVPFQRRVTLKEGDETEKRIQIGVEKLTQDAHFSDFLLITFEEQDLPQVGGLSEVLYQEADQTFFAQRIIELERDLKVTEESLQSTIEELETSNEELQATNEELMASNEELQSTNEELHSVNEELYTVSAEHQRKIDELTELTDDMENLLRATDIGTIFVDPELRIRRFTPAAARTFNLVQHDIGRPLEHITYRFDYPDLISDVNAVRERGVTTSREIDVDGNTCLLRILPYKSQSEDNRGAVVTVIDIQELRLAQNELAEQRMLYENVVQLQNDLICRYRLDGTLTFVNNAMCRFLGKSRDELVGTEVFVYGDDGYTKSARPAIANLAHGGENTSVYKVADSNNRMRWIHVSRYALRDLAGDVREIQSVGRDITELRRAQANLELLNSQLAAEREQLSRIYRNTPVKLCSFVADGTFVDVSKYMLDWMACPRDDVIGRPIYDFMTPESAERARTLVDDIFTRSTPGYDHYTFLRSDGTTRDVRMSAIVAQDGSHKPQSFAVLFDVTEQRNAERTLAEQNHELARINENLNQFTHIVSHDLTGPLRAIQHTTHWIEEDLPEPGRDQIQEHLDRLKDQVAHLSGMLSDLMEYSRAGSSQHAAESIDLHQSLRDIYEVIDNPEEIQLDFETLPERVFAFRAPLLLVFRNLIENAVKYHHSDCGRIVVRAKDLGGKWAFEVEDDGPGIDPKFHDKVLLPFRKLERKDKVPGSGMGLALVKKAVESNDGELTIDSQPAERPGTRIIFTWPKIGNPY